MADIESVNDRDIDLLKQTFKGNETLLKTMRALFFGFPLLDDQKTLIKSTFANPTLKEAVRKKFYPQLDLEVPIGQVVDFWLGTEQQMFGAPRDQIQQAYEVKERLEEMLIGAMNLLSDPDGERVDLTAKMSIASDPLAIRMISRNLFLKTMETGLNYINLTANQVEETPAEVKKNAKKNSTE